MLYKSKVGLLTVAALIALIIPLAFGATEVYSDDAPPPTPDATPADSVAGDRAALAALYNATDGQGWRKRTNWLSTYAPLSYWYGVRTDSSGRVIELNLATNRLSGEIPPELGNLTNLQHLNLISNRLSGEIPPELGKLTNLQHLNLSWNRLSGKIPPEFGNLTNLQHLNLSGNNQLSGEIPPEFGNLTNLQGIYISHTKLSGEIPPEFGNLTNLRTLSLGNNQLSGEIPPEFGNLTNLQGIYISHTKLSGEIPPEFGNLTNLQRLSLSHNQLSGEIPPEFGNLTNLRMLSLSHTKLSGKLPPEFGNLTNLGTLSLSHNQLSGEIPPEFGNLTNLQGIYISHNQLSGEIPPELGNLTRLQLLHLDHNQLSGEIPPELGNLTRLQGLDLDHNRLSGEIPPELDKLTYLWGLNLSGNNQLSGKIPAGLGRLPYLWDLRLSDTNVECFPEGFSSRVIDQLVEQGLHACPAASIPPPTPRGLSVYWRDLSDYWTGGVFHINWLAMPGAASYQVLYRPDQAGSVWTGLETVQSTYAGFRPASAYQCGTTYGFRIRAYGDGVAYSAAFGPFSKAIFKPTEACPENQVPEFDAASYIFLISEAVSAGDFVGLVSAADPDDDTLTYSLSGGDAASFELDAATGRLTTNPGVTYNYETKSLYALTVTASDGKNGQTTSTVSIHIKMPNRPATGAPVITGTVQAGHTLTADPSGIADSDGLVNAAFFYQWLADDANVAGATGSSYTPVAIDVGKAIKVRMSFTDDARYEETLTSAAVYIPRPPLHGGFDASTAPDSHDGSASFSFEIHFSEEPDLGYANVRDHVLTVAYGDVTGAKRKTAGANIRWVITVQPDGNDAVTIALPSTTDCAASSAVCTEDGRMLSNRTSITVPGPADEPPLETTEQPQENGGQPEETANSPATGAPTITGTVQAGHTLTADPSGIADSDGLVNAAFFYQWLADDANVAGATGSSYTPVPIDVGKAIKVRVSFTDDARYEETLTSAAVYIPRPPLHGGFDASTAPDSHDGSASFSFEIHFSEEPDLGYANVRDHVLTVAYGDVTGAKRKTAGANIRWVITVQPDGNDAVTIALPSTTDCAASSAVCTEDGRMLSNRTSITVPGPADEPPLETKEQPQENGGEREETANSPATGAPTITGTAQAGHTLTADPSGIADADGLVNAAFFYQWLADDANVAGATGSSYTPVPIDVGKAIKVRVSFTDDARYEETLTSAAVYIPPPPLHGGFDASTAPDSHDGSASFSFEIHFSEEPDLGYANVRDHVLTVAYGDVTGAKRKTAGANIRWVITVQPDGNDAVTIALPSTTDCAASSAVCTEDGRMLSNRTSITVPGPADKPPLETAEQPQENGGQPEETANSPATGAPTITGTAQAGHTLTADPSGIADSDGLVNAAFVYQWLADDANVAGATGSSYTPVAIDVGKAIKVRVSFTDDARYEETLTSAAVYIPRPPLHGGFDASTAPDSHDGSASFSFEIHFSEEPDLGYANVRDHVLTVAYGDVTGAKRKTAGANIRWVITVQPDGNDAVTIALPSTTDCAASSAVCTEDGRMLSNRTSITVPGPADEPPLETAEQPQEDS